MFIKVNLKDYLLYLKILTSYTFGTFCNSLNSSKFTYRNGKLQHKTSFAESNNNSNKILNSFLQAQGIKSCQGPE